MKRDADGHTEAEAVMHRYRTSPVSPSDSGAQGSSLRPLSTVKERPPSTAGALTYIDEDFNYYPSRRPTETDAHDASLVRNAAEPGRSRGFQDLGARLV